MYVDYTKRHLKNNSTNDYKIVGESNGAIFSVFHKEHERGKKTSLNFGTSNVFILLERLILMQRDQSELICLVSQRTHLFVQNKIALINEAALGGSGILSIFWT